MTVAVAVVMMRRGGSGVAGVGAGLVAAAVGGGGAARSSGGGWLAVGQMRATNDVEANLRQCAHLAHLAALRRCSLLCLPEGSLPSSWLLLGFCAVMGSEQMVVGGGRVQHSTSWGRPRERPCRVAEPLDGPLMTRYRDLARSHGTYLVSYPRG